MERGYQHSTLIGVVFDGEGKQRSQSTRPGSEASRRRWGKARSRTWLLGALAGAPGDPPGLPRMTEPLGWQPSRFLTDRAEAECAFALAEQLGSVATRRIAGGVTFSLPRGSQLNQSAMTSWSRAAIRS